MTKKEALEQTRERYPELSREDQEEIAHWVNVYKTETKEQAAQRLYAEYQLIKAEHPTITVVPASALPAAITGKPPSGEDGLN